MQTFKIRPECYHQTVRGAVRHSAIVYAVFAVLIVLYNLYKMRENYELFNLLITLILLAAVFGYSLYRIAKKIRNQLPLYELSINGDNIVREDGSSPTASIPFGHIHSIEKTARGSLIITSESKKQMITVPHTIERYDELYALLNKITPIAAIRKTEYIQPALWVIGIIILIIGFYATDDQRIGIPSGLVLLAILTFGFFTIRKNKHLPHSTQRLAWWLIVFMVIITLRLVDLMEWY